MTFTIYLYILQCLFQCSLREFNWYRESLKLLYLYCLACPQRVPGAGQAQTGGSQEARKQEEVQGWPQACFLDQGPSQAPRAG